MFLRQISTLTYKFFFDPAQLRGGGEEEKEYQSNSKSKILRFLLNSYFRFDEISSKMLLILSKFELSMSFDFIYKKTITFEYLYFERNFTFFFGRQIYVVARKFFTY